jgi:DNA polymerase-3 subunit delta
MPEISHKKLDDYLDGLKTSTTEAFAPVYLIYGEEMLVKGVYDALLDCLLPAASRSLNYDPVDGATENIRDVIERVNTFSLLPGIKIVALLDSKIFYTRQDKPRLLDNAKSAYENDDLEKAATYFLNLMGHLNLSFDDLSKSNRSKALGVDGEYLSDDAWLDTIIGYCQQHHLSVPAPQDDCTAMQRAIEKGFPANNHLIITTEAVDKRRGLFKAVGRMGLIIDCSVPKGERRADKLAQQNILIEKMSAMLKASGKKMDKAAYGAMYELTGFDLRTFSNNLEKLINYVGDNDTITLDDVESVLRRTKKDPIFDLTNAICDRNFEQALFYLDSILTAGFHPLQVLAAITSQIRKLLLVKDFVESPLGSNWHAGCSYDRFQKSVMPEIVAYDKKLLTQIENWRATLSNADNSEDVKATPKSKKKITTDLLIARSPKNPYPAFQLFLKSERFTKNDLLDALELLSEADMQLKSTGQDPKLVLERAIFGICKSQQGV